MIEDDIHQLDQLPVDRSLDLLETDIWRGVAARALKRQAARKVVSLQCAVMVCALFGSVVAGISLGRPNRTAGAAAVLATGAELMPSSLLLGGHR
jgi:hypothetical protein